MTRTVEHIALSLCLSVIAATANADTVFLKSGVQIEGHIVSQTENSYRIETGTTTFDLPSGMIQRIVKYKHRDASLVLLGDDMARQGDFTMAQQYYERAMAITENRSIVQQRLDKLNEMRLRRHEVVGIDEAIKAKEYRKAGDMCLAMIEGRGEDPFTVEMRKKASDAYCMLARQYFDEVRTEEAVEELRKAINLDSLNPRAHALAGMINARTSKYKQAREELMLAQELGPTDPAVIESLHFLEQLPDAGSELQLANARQAEDTRSIDQLIGTSEFTGNTAGINYALLTGRTQRMESVHFDMNALAHVSLPRASNDFYQFRSSRALSIFLQAYNAGPGAATMYNGKVPYTETVNYVQRVARAINDINSGKMPASPYDALIEKYALQYGFHPTLIKAIVKVESDFNPECVSTANARGLIQLVRCDWDDTMRRLGQNLDFRANVADPELNLMVGCHYLRWLVDECLPKYFKEDFG